jgi:putative FmdB family regulatory protein
MPIYEYQCSHCRYYLEIMQKISDAKLKKCPSCGRNTLQKLISAPVFRLKGSGWYETDFKSDQEQKRNLVAVEKQPAVADAKDGKDTKDTKDAKDAGTKDSKEGKGGGETGTDAKPAASEAKGAPGAGDKTPDKPAKAGSRGKTTARRAAKPTRRFASTTRSSRRRGRR